MALIGGTDTNVTISPTTISSTTGAESQTGGAGALNLIKSKKNSIYQALGGTVTVALGDKPLEQLNSPVPVSSLNLALIALAAIFILPKIMK